MLEGPHRTSEIGEGETLGFLVELFNWFKIVSGLSYGSGYWVLMTYFLNCKLHTENPFVKIMRLQVGPPLRFEEIEGIPNNEKPWLYSDSRSSSVGQIPSYTGFHVRKWGNKSEDAH
ncbi:hypothetical protein V6N12_043101 [Hibiscus sabdariffa]|uniref:Uncharacterized protein n=1 Tax=Hibiscus sabdariffa TaxID=183260 RepID=A0ABR2DI98_9ROSI